MSNLSWHVTDKPTCDICEQYLGLQWTDTHGVAVCLNCGAGYQILYYDEKNNCTAKLSVPNVKPKYLPVLRRYVAETGRKFPSGFNFPSSSYEFVSQEDSEAFGEWMRNRADAILAEAAAT